MLRPDHFVPAEQLAVLDHGSLESILDNITDAVESRFGGDAMVLATHDNAVAVVVDEGFFAVPWTMTGTVVELGEASPLDIEVMNPLRAADYMWGQARRAVDLMAEGKSEDSRNQLRGIMSCMKPEYLDPTGLAKDAFTESVGDDRPWVKFYSERAAEIRKYCYGRVGRVEGRKIKTRFKKLVAGKVNAGESDRHGLVVALRALEDRAREIRGAVSSIEAPQVEDSTIEEDGILGTITSLHGDLADAVESVCKDLGSLVRLSSRTGSVVELAKIHDELAERLYDMDLVYEFVARAAERLNKEIQA